MPEIPDEAIRDNREFDVAKLLAEEGIDIKRMSPADAMDAVAEAEMLIDARYAVQETLANNPEIQWGVPGRSLDDYDMLSMAGMSDEIISQRFREFKPNGSD